MKKNVDVNLKVYLSDFGLTDREISLYLTLLKTGPNTIMNLARETGIKRSTTHNNVEELIKKGLVSQTNYGERRMVVAESPEKLKFLVEQKRWTVKKLEENLGGVVNMINEMIPGAEERNKVEVKYYNGESGFREVCQRSIDLAEEEIMIMSNSDEFYKVFTPDYDKGVFIPSRLKKGVNVRNLLVANGSASKIQKEDMKEKRETRFLPENMNFTTTIFIYKGEVSIMVSGEPYTAIVLTSEEIANTFTNMFNTFWEISVK